MLNIIKILYKYASRNTLKNIDYSTVIYDRIYVKYTYIYI